MTDTVPFPFGDSGPSPLPDESTSEAILYGPAYSWVKNALWLWDEMDYYLRKKADSLESQINDREWAYHVMTHNPYLINARSPPVNEVSKLRDLRTLRSLVKCETAVSMIDRYRRQNIAWARMKGIERYVQGREGMGISESEWSAATAPFSMEPISFDSVHGIGPSTYAPEDVDIRQVMTEILGEEEYRALEDRVWGRREIPDGPEPEIREPAPEPPPSLSFLDELDGMFRSPIDEAYDLLASVDDECSACADWWEESNVYGRGLIDDLIAYAEG